MKVLACDPSITCTGLASVDLTRGRVVAWDAFKTRPNPRLGLASDQDAERYYEIAAHFKAYYLTHGGVIVLEAQSGAGFPHGPKGRRVNPALAAKVLGAYCAILGASNTRPLVLSPAEVKRRLGAVGKEEAWVKARAALPGGAPPEPGSRDAREAVHDAVAVAVAARPEVERVQALLGAS